MNWKYYKPKFEYEEKFQDFNWPWSGHKFFAYDLVANLKPNRIVELGTHYGTSLWSFSQAVKDNFLETEINAVDTWEGEKHAGFYGEEVFETVKQIKDEYYTDLKINLIKKTFDDALKDFDNNSVDIIHIDGLHTYAAVKHDFESWLLKVKDDGIILFHDIDVEEDDFGVYKLWEELRKQYKTIEFQHSFGLGVLFKGDIKIGDVGINNHESLQRHYYYLHESIKNEKLRLSLDIINQKNKEITQKDQEITQKDQEIKLMKSSKFWRLRNEYIYLVNGTKLMLLSPEKFIKKYFKKQDDKR